jgi:hypothetical protein
MKRATLATLVAVVVSLFVSGLQLPADAQTAGATQTQTPARKKYVPPVKGVAEVGILKPKVDVDKKTNEVVTIIKIKNLSMGAIAGLRVDEFWYDKGGNMLPGDSERLRQPLNPGEVATIELRTPRNPKMDRNSYQFSHANGQVKTKQLTKME